MLNKLKEFPRDRSGVTSIEYALIAALVAVVIVAAVASAGTTLNNLFTKLEGCLSSLTAAACT